MTATMNSTDSNSTLHTDMEAMRQELNDLRIYMTSIKETINSPAPNTQQTQWKQEAATLQQDIDSINTKLQAFATATLEQQTAITKVVDTLVSMDRQRSKDSSTFASQLQQLQNSIDSIIMQAKDSETDSDDEEMHHTTQKKRHQDPFTPQRPNRSQNTQDIMELEDELPRHSSKKLYTKPSPQRKQGTRSLSPAKRTSLRQAQLQLGRKNPSQLEPSPTSQDGGSQK